MMKEGSFNEKKEKYNLEPKLFESYHLALQAKSECCSLKSILDVANSNGDVIDLVNQRMLLTAADVISAANAIWRDFGATLDDDAKCIIHNQHIKQKTLGEYILSSLTDSAIRKLQNSKDQHER